MDLFRALNKSNVKYIVIGGYAVNYYGYSRMTEDIDIFFLPEKENGRKLLQALESLGYDTTTFNKENFEESIHIRLGEVPNTIDLINETVGIDPTRSIENAEVHKISEVEVPFISLEDLISNKKALNTYKDLADAEMLEKEIKKRRRQ